jgi:LemA protein
MANALDELNPVVNEAGRDVNVIEKQLPIKVGRGSKFFEIILWVLGIIPGIIFLVMKINAGKYLSQLEQKLQHDASTIDNYLEQRVMILKNAAQLVTKAVELDKETYTKIAELRSGGGQRLTDVERNQVAAKVDDLSRNINIAFEQYPQLQAHGEIRDAMQQNNYLQREITAAREVYNDTINTWNRAVYEWPTKMIVAAKRGYTTRVPFSTSKEVKEAARGTFF